MSKKVALFYAGTELQERLRLLLEKQGISVFAVCAPPIVGYPDHDSWYQAIAGQLGKFQPDLLVCGLSSEMGTNGNWATATYHMGWLRRQQPDVPLLVCSKWLESRRSMFQIPFGGSLGQRALAEGATHLLSALLLPAAGDVLPCLSFLLRQASLPDTLPEGLVRPI